jgi:hypothetical protein
MSKKWWLGTKTIRFPFKEGVVVLGTLETGENTYTYDLWNAGYRVSLKSFLGKKYLYFANPPTGNDTRE